MLVEEGRKLKEKLRANPFAILMPGALLLLTLLVLVGLQARTTAEPVLPPKLQPFDDLVRPALRQERMVEIAAEFLRARGYEPDQFLHGLWQDLDRKAFDFLKKKHPTRLAEFVSRGAPLVTWSVTFFRPREKEEQGERLSVYLDAKGGVCGFSSYRYSPGQLREPRSAEWEESTRRRIASWLKIDENRLKPMGKTVLTGRSHAQADAVWTIDGLKLGDARVIVSVLQRGELLNFRKRILLPGSPTDVGYAVKGYAYWSAIFLALPLAFLMGWRWRQDGPGPSLVTDKIVPLTGLGFASIICTVQAIVLLQTSQNMNRLVAAGFIALVLFFGSLGIFLWGQGLPSKAKPVARWMRWGLFGAVPLSYVFMFLGCSANLFTGCSSVCTLVRFTFAPLALFALILGWRDRRFYAYAVMLCASSLVPHCICDNFINHSWIEWMGASPMCYFACYCVALISVIGLSGVLPKLCLVFSAGSTAVVAVMGLSHQLFRFPW